MRIESENYWFTINDYYFVVCSLRPCCTNNTFRLLLFTRFFFSRPFHRRFDFIGSNMLESGTYDFVINQFAAVIGATNLGCWFVDSVIWFEWVTHGFSGRKIMTSVIAVGVGLVERSGGRIYSKFDGEWFLWRLIMTPVLVSYSNNGSAFKKASSTQNQNASNQYQPTALTCNAIKPLIKRKALSIEKTSTNIAVNRMESPFIDRNVWNNLMEI